MGVFKAFEYKYRHRNRFKLGMDLGMDMELDINKERLDIDIIIEMNSIYFQWEICSEYPSSSRHRILSSFTSLES